MDLNTLGALAKLESKEACCFSLHPFSSIKIGTKIVELTIVYSQEIIIFEN